MNRRAIVIGTSVAIVAAFAAAAAFYPKVKVAQAPAEDNTLVRPHAPVIGPPDAPVTIVEFLDPACEACRAFYPLVKEIMAAFPGKTKLVIRYAPLHDGSDEAVRLLEAARLQDKFVPVLEAVFEQQPQWAVHGSPDLDKLWTVAGAAGLDVSKAREDAKSAEIATLLEQDIKDMEAVKLQGTPTFFVNGRPLESFGPQQLYDLVEVEVKAVGDTPPSGS